MSRKDSKGYNLSFAGCGFLGLYHAGVCGCIQEFAPQLYENQKISGASAGAIAATFLVCNVKLSDCVQYLMQTINIARSYTLGPFDPRFQVTKLLREGLELYLPDNAHILCSGRLHISMTSQTSKENYIAKTFKDKNELIKAVLCSSYIPIFSGFIPLTFRGEWMIDGAFTRNMLKLDGRTITVSPFAGDADICPRDDWGYGQLSVAGTSFLLNYDNIRRLLNIFWPKSPEELGKLTQLGYSDALQFLARKGFIKCNLHRHHTSFMQMKVRSQYKIIDENCKRCRTSLQVALNSSLSNSILVCFIPPKPISLYGNFLAKKFMGYLKMLTRVATMPISLSIKIIGRCVLILKSLPSHFIGSLVNVVRTLTCLDEIFKKALSNAMESNYQHAYLCDSLDNFRHSVCNTHIEMGYETFDSTESDDSMEVMDSDDSSINLSSGVDKEQIELIRQQVQNLDEVVDDIYIESFDGSNFFPQEIRSEAEGSENKETEDALLRGKADGSESDPPRSMKETSHGLYLDLDHQMSWSYPDIDHPGQINYCVLAPIAEAVCTNSSDES